VLYKKLEGNLKLPRLIYKQLNYVVSKTDKIKLLSIVLIQTFLSLLDVLGVAITGLVSALAVSGIQSKSSSQGVSKIINFIHIQNLSFQTQVGFLSVLAVLVLLLRTLISIYFIRRIYRFFSYKSAELSADLIMKVLGQNLLKVREKTTQETLYSVTHGVDYLMMGTFANAINLISDFSILIFIIIALVIVDPIIAISTGFMFFFISILINRIVNKRAQFIGNADSSLQIESNSKIVEVLTSYRELFVQSRLFYYSNEIRNLRVKLAKYQAEFTFMPNISKYIMEVTVVIGSLVISGIQFLAQDAAHAVAVLSVFLAASTRIAPAVLRMQQGAISVKSSLGAAKPTLELMESLEHISPILESSDEVDYEHHGFVASVEMRDVTVTYPGKTTPALSKVSLVIKPGQIVALVGPSGAGKTTIVDVILGVLPPQSGKVSISGAPSLDAIERWSGAISYVPQDVMISNGTVRENVTMGYPENLSWDKQVWEALGIAQLADFVGGLSEKLDSQVGDRGTKISGGQRQRLGIARAMFTKPQLLVLDEATSSLDGETEANISDAIQAMRGSVTVLMIAHRLATVRHADILVYLEEGHIRAVGTFDEVRLAVPDFDRQAQLMGL
jgi:ABC-type multidrug transport system fused ATPase/permease subunit